MTDYQAPLRLLLDGDALVANWRWLAAKSGQAACGAAVKANGYGLGATEVVRRLRAAGCRDFFVATWAEALTLHLAGQGDGIAVLHGVRDEDLAQALSLPQIRPVLNSAAQVARWRSAAPGRPCDVMIDTGMNRLGLSSAEAQSGLLDGLTINTLMSHLVAADEDSARNCKQLQDFSEAAQAIPATRYSLANSAGICFGGDYAFGLTRPGLALYGAIPRPEAVGHIRQVVWPEAQIIQRRLVPRGQSVGYNATWVAERDTAIAIVNLGYADGYLRGFSGTGAATFNGEKLPVIGRVSMDLIAMALPPSCQAAEGDWVAIDYDLSTASAQSGLSSYELLTGLGPRYDRVWR